MGDSMADKFSNETIEKSEEEIGTEIISDNLSEDREYDALS